MVEIPRRDGILTYPESIGEELLDGRLVTNGDLASDWCTLADFEVTVLNPTEGTVTLVILGAVMMVADSLIEPPPPSVVGYHRRR